MNVAQLTARAQQELKRPDMADRLKALVRQTIIKVHNASEFQKDLVEELVAVPSPSTNMRLLCPPRLRRFLAVYPADSLGSIYPTRNPEGGYLFVQPNELVTQSGRQMVDIAYVAATTLNIRSGLAPSHLLMQYFQEPDVSDDNCSTWITQQYADLIMEGVRSRYYMSVNSDLQRGEIALFNDSLEALISQHGSVR